MTERARPAPLLTDRYYIAPFQGSVEDLVEPCSRSFSDGGASRYDHQETLPALYRALPPALLCRRGSDERLVSRG
jgi:hypothetical protein